MYDIRFPCSIWDQRHGRGRIVRGDPPRKVLRRFKPDVVLFGYDQIEVERAFREFVASKGIKVKIVRAKPLPGTEKMSTTAILNRAVSKLGLGDGYEGRLRLEDNWREDLRDRDLLRDREPHLAQQNRRDLRIR
jgi:hypothetical protein